MEPSGQDHTDRVGGQQLVHWHRTNGTETTADSYRAHYRRVLLNGLRRTTIIYLDTNYWVWLRKAELGCGSPHKVALLQILRVMVRSSEAICVSHITSLNEIGKQEESSLRVIAGLLDELTEGIAIAAIPDLRAWDCGRFIQATLAAVADDQPFNWTNAGQIHQHALPLNMLDSASEFNRNVVTKASIDVFWNATFEDVFTAFQWDTKRKLSADIDIDVIAQIEARKATQRAAALSRERVRVNEFSWFVRHEFGPIFAAQLRAWHIRHGFPLGVGAGAEQLNTLLDTAVNNFKKRTLGVLLSSAAIVVELYAIYETSHSNRRFTANGWADWNHAAAALPNCDLFLIEGHLAHQLKQELGADKQYECTVIGSLAEAIKVLRGMSGS